MKIRHMGIAMLLILFAIMPIAADQHQEADPPTDVEDPVLPDQEDPWDTEEDDPLAPETEEPWDTEEDDPWAIDDEDETALDVIADHERTSRAYELFGDEFAATLDAEMRQMAFFVPVDEVLEDVDRDDLTEEELQNIAARHAATGIVAMQSLEFVDSFMTMDGEMIMVSVDDEGNITLNDRVKVVETIEIANGFVYIIDGRLDENGEYDEDDDAA